MQSRNACLYAGSCPAEDIPLSSRWSSRDAEPLMVPDVLVLPDVPDIVPLPDALRSDVPDVLPVPEELRSDVLGDVTLPDTLPPDVLGEVALPEALPPFDGVLVTA